MKPVLLVVCDRDPLTVKALAKESKIDPEFRRQMWRLCQEGIVKIWSRAAKVAPKMQSAGHRLKVLLERHLHRSVLVKPNISAECV